MDNVNQKSQQTICLSGKTQFYSESLGRATLAPGLYKMTGVRLANEMVPGFLPVEVTNDEPLDIDSSVSDILKEFDDFFQLNIFVDYNFFLIF